MSRLNDRTVYDILGRYPVHPFPARMAPSLALDVVSEFKEPKRILDPMCGSGTVLAVANSKGHQAIGVDLDPLAVLISKVWTTALDRAAVQDTAANVLRRAQRVSKSLNETDAYPKNSDDETRRFVRFWFDPDARKQLASLAAAIEEIREDSTSDALWCAFSRLIIAKRSGASRAMDLSHSRPHRVFERAQLEPFHGFLSAANHVTSNCIDSEAGATVPTSKVEEGDARNVSLEDASIDLIITSPPYLNAIDYIRCSKFSLIWMGHSISAARHLRSDMVGVEKGMSPSDDPEIRHILADLSLQPQLPRKYQAILARYVDDMRRIVAENARVLRDTGKAVYVIGENTIHGTVVRNASIIEAVAATSGLRRTDRKSRELPANRRYLPPPSAQSDTASLAKRMRQEVVLTFEKAA